MDEPIVLVRLHTFDRGAVAPGDDYTVAATAQNRQSVLAAGDCDRPAWRRPPSVWVARRHPLCADLDAVPPFAAVVEALLGGRVVAVRRWGAGRRQRILQVIAFCNMMLSQLARQKARHI